jgi:flagellar basal body-associated protein FliL
MSEEGEKPAEANAAAAPKKGKMGLIIGIVVAVVTLVGGSVAGAVLGPKLLGGADDEAPAGKHEKSAKGEKSHKPEKADKSEHGEEGEEGAEGSGKVSTFDISSVVVDLRDGDGRIRHLKVGLTAEVGEHAPMEEIKAVVPRAREAAITYLRSLSFEEVSDPQHFVTIKDELGKRVMESLGEDRVRRMVLTDFVVQ